MHGQNKWIKCDLFPSDHHLVNSWNGYIFFFVCFFFTNNFLETIICNIKNVWILNVLIKDEFLLHSINWQKNAAQFSQVMSQRLNFLMMMTQERKSCPFSWHCVSIQGNRIRSIKIIAMLKIHFIIIRVIKMQFILSQIEYEYEHEHEHGQWHGINTVPQFLLLPSCVLILLIA